MELKNSNFSLSNGNTFERFHWRLSGGGNCYFFIKNMFNIEKFKQDWHSKNSAPAMIDAIIERKEISVKELVEIGIKHSKSTKRHQRIRYDMFKTIKKWVIWGFIIVTPGSDKVTFNEDFIPINQQ